MGPLNRAIDALKSTQEQGCEVEPSLKQSLKAYKQQADEAERLLREKQAKDRKEL